MLTNEMSSCKVSIIIPTLNAGEGLRVLLEKLTEQTVQPYEIIIADSESSDGTVDIAKCYGANVLPIERKQFDHGSTRNVAAEQASGNILIFMTQDVIPLDDKLIENLVRPLVEEDSKGRIIAYSYARQIADETAPIFERLAREINYPEHALIKGYEDIERLGVKTFFCSNACSALRKDIFLQQGGFVSPTIFNEDMFMAARCVLSGKYIAYCADALVYHTHAYTLKEQFKRYFDNGMSMRTQEWILPYAKAGKAGAGLVKKQLIALKHEKKLYLTPLLVIESTVKLLGYKLGINVNRLPKAVSRKLSMHTLIWEKMSAMSTTSSTIQSQDDTKSIREEL